MNEPTAVGTAAGAGAGRADDLGHDGAYVAALLMLPGMGPHRLDRLLAAAGSAEGAWRWVRGGGGAGVSTPDLRGDLRRLHGSWSTAAAAVDPGELLAIHRTRGVVLLGRGTVGYPERLVDDPDPPALLFARGDVDLLRGPTVAVVGTRRATAYGLRLARAWGHALAAAGVVVVSGLAAGIDAAAHDGVLAAVTGAGASHGESAGRVIPGPLAVVGTGIDVPYPPSSRPLWARVAAAGLIVAEVPLGTRPEPWRFPARNRIIAGLADAVVVVESHERGGSLLTAEEALDRDRPVLAVPGSVHSPASAGTHRLLGEGAMVATSVDDVLAALGSRAPRSASGRQRPDRVERPAGTRSTATQGTARRGGDVGGQAAELLDALGWEPATIDDLVDRTGWSLGVVCAVTDSLVRAGTVHHDGRWLTYRGDSGAS